MKAHQFYKGLTVESLAKINQHPARTKFRVIDVILRHKNDPNVIKFEGEPVVYPARVQMKLADTEKLDPFKKGPRPRRVFNFVESKPNEDFPFK